MTEVTIIKNLFLKAKRVNIDVLITVKILDIAETPFEVKIQFIPKISRKIKTFVDNFTNLLL